MICDADMTDLRPKSVDELNFELTCPGARSGAMNLVLMLAVVTFVVRLTSH